MKAFPAHRLFLFTVLCLLSSSAFAQLEIRFANLSTNPDSAVQLLPDSTNPTATFSWVTTNAAKVTTNNWTNWSQMSNQASICLTNFPVTGKDVAGKPYRSIYTTNYPSGVWYVCYGGTNLPLSATPPSPNSTNGTWNGYQYNSFELTLDGNSADQMDVTMINSFSIPLVLYSYTNTNPVSPIYQSCGWARFPGTTNLTFSQVVTNLLTIMPSAAKLDGHGSVVTIVGPASATLGSLSVLSGSSVKQVPQFTDYFQVVKTNTSRVTKIKDFVGYPFPAGFKSKGASFSSYDFDLTITSSNSILLTGSITITNTVVNPPSTNTYNNLTIEIQPDSTNPLNTTNYWASSYIYNEGTPANYLIAPKKPLLSANGAPVLKLTGQWLAVNSNAAAGIEPVATPLWSNTFYTSIIGRIMGDAGAGFNLGFINSNVKNPNYSNGTVAFGDSPSGAWWGGNMYPHCTNNDLVYAELQPKLSSNGNTFYSTYSGMIFSGAQPVYTSAVLDRVSALGVAISCATNGAPPIKAVELRMLNGISGVPVPIVKPSQTITFAPIIPPTYTNPIGTAPLTVFASSGLPVTLTITNTNNPAAIIAQNVNNQYLKITNAGTNQIIATQPGNSLFRAATPVTNTLVVLKGNEYIIWNTNNVVPANFVVPPPSNPWLVSLIAGPHSIVQSSDPANNGSIILTSSDTSIASTNNSGGYAGAGSLWVFKNGSCTISATIPANSNYNSSSISNNVMTFTHP